MNRDELARLLALAMNLLNDIDRDGFTDAQLGDYHELAAAVPERCDYANNGTVMPADLLKR